jgi:hypothetical protein
LVLHLLHHRVARLELLRLHDHLLGVRAHHEWLSVGLLHHGQAGHHHRRQLDFKRTPELRVVQVVKHDVHVVFAETASLNEVLHLEHVKAHLLRLL